MKHRDPEAWRCCPAVCGIDYGEIIVDGRNPAPVNTIVNTCRDIYLIIYTGFIHPRGLFGISSDSIMATDYKYTDYLEDHPSK